MANYTLFGSAISLFDAWTGGSFAAARLYNTNTEFGIQNADGSKTFFIGTGLVWDQAAGKFTAGTIQQISHYSAGGFTDQLSGLSLSADAVQAAFQQAGVSTETLRSYFFNGNDVFDARYRVGDQALPTKFIGYGGNDLIYGGKGANEFWGYTGQDTINGGSGSDFVNGGADNDTIQGGGGNDRLIGDGGADRVTGGEGNDAIYAGAGSDTIIGSAGSDTAVYYRSFFDLIVTVTSSGVQLIEPNGQDTFTEIEFIAADEGSFAFNAATGKWDLVSATPGASLIEPSNFVQGSQSADAMNLGGTGKTNALGLGGNDTMTGTSGWDFMMGGAGNDTLNGETNAYSSNAGQDRLHGEDGDDRIFGMGGTDLIYGGNGNDTLSGGNGNDTITGGSGADRFVFRYATDPASREVWNNDIINDFTVGTDRIELQFGPWDGAAPASLTPTLSLTQAGWTLTLADAGSILLKGLTVPGLTLADLLA